MFSHAKREEDWIPGTAYLDGSVDSDIPTWLLRARKGRRWVDLAAGPMWRRSVGEWLARMMNDTDPLQWDLVAGRELKLFLGEQGPHESWGPKPELPKCGGRYLGASRVHRKHRVDFVLAVELDESGEVVGQVFGDRPRCGGRMFALRPITYKGVS